MTYAAATYGAGIWGAGNYAIGDWGGLHPDTVNYRDRLLAKSGASIDANTLNATDVFVRGLHNDAIWQKLRVLWLMAGNFAGLPTALKHPTGNVTLFNFVSGDFLESLGLEPGTTNATKYVSLGISSADLPLNSISIGFHCQTNVAGNSREMGNTAGTIQLLASFSGTSFWDCYNSTASQGRASAVVSTSQGFYVGSRLNSTDSRIYKNGSQIAAIAGAGGTTSAVSIDLFRAAGAFGFRRLSMCFVGEGLTATEVASIYNRYSTFATNIGRSL